MDGGCFVSEFQIFASVSCMDQCRFAEEMKKVEASAVSRYHYDVVDGKFNRCFILGETTLQYFKREAGLEVEVHLAAYEPEDYIEIFAKAGADYIAVHVETMEDPLHTFDMIRRLGAKPVLAFRAETAPDERFVELAKEVEWILKLTVNPGFAGQPIQPIAIEHIAQMRKLLDEHGVSTPIQADGNITVHTIPKLVEAGATIFTGGSSGLFLKDMTVTESCQRLLAAAENAK